MIREKLEHMNPRALYLKCRSLDIPMRRGETPPKEDMIEMILACEGEDYSPGTEFEVVSYNSFTAKEAVEEIEKTDEEELLAMLSFELNRDNGPRITVLAALEARGIEIPTTGEKDEDTTARETTDGNQDCDNSSGEEIG